MLLNDNGSFFPFSFEVALGILTFLSYFELQILFGSSQ